MAEAKNKELSFSLTSLQFLPHGMTNMVDKDALRQQVDGEALKILAWLPDLYSPPLTFVDSSLSTAFTSSNLLP